MQPHIALPIARTVVCGALLFVASCSDKASAPVHQAPLVQVELLAWDTAFAPRGERPLIAGEKAHLAVAIRGGRAPYELQIATKLGDPRLVTDSITIETKPGSEATAAVELVLGSEVPSGTYALTIRISDDDGESSSIDSENFEVVGSDAPTFAAASDPLRLRVVDVAGRARRSFYQGEEIAIRATLPAPEPLAIVIVATDERPFMPKQHYPAQSTDIHVPLRVPRVARVGAYRVDIATENAQASVPLLIEGTQFAPVSKPTLSKLHIFTGPKQRLPREGILTRGEAVRIEALVGGVAQQASARLRLRTQVGKQVAVHDFPQVMPADPAPSARSMLSDLWTPPTSLDRGRHMLELELEEGGQVATLYRELMVE